MFQYAWIGGPMAKPAARRLGGRSRRSGTHQPTELRRTIVIGVIQGIGLGYNGRDHAGHAEAPR